MRDLSMAEQEFSIAGIEDFARCRLTSQEFDKSRAICSSDDSRSSGVIYLPTEYNCSGGGVFDCVILTTQEPSSSKGWEVFNS